MGFVHGCVFCKGKYDKSGRNSLIRVKKKKKNEKNVLRFRCYVLSKRGKNIFRARDAGLFL
jgi:hypothetical protein